MNYKDYSIIRSALEVAHIEFAFRNSEHQGHFSKSGLNEIENALYVLSKHYDGSLKTEPLEIIRTLTEVEEKHLQ